jgi:hypothetical protein
MKNFIAVTAIDVFIYMLLSKNNNYFLFFLFFPRSSRLLSYTYILNKLCEESLVDIFKLEHERKELWKLLCTSNSKKQYI